jgi:hypothetical protein
VWRVGGESGVLSRFEALQSQAAPLVGATKNSISCCAGRQAKTGEARVVLLSGAARGR